MSGHARHWGSRQRAAFSLLELLAVVTILGIIAAVIIPRIGGHTLVAKKNACNQYVSDLNSAIERYFFETGDWPSSVDDLHPDYYPESVPNCPVLNAPYSIDGTIHRIADHAHP